MSSSMKHWSWCPILFCFPTASWCAKWPHTRWLKNKRNSVSQSFGDQKFKIKVFSESHSLWGVARRTLPCLFQFLEAPDVLSLTLPNSAGPPSSHGFLRVSLYLKPHPAFLLWGHLSLDLGPTLIKDNLQGLSLNSTYKDSFPKYGHIHRFQGLRHRHIFWGPPLNLWPWRCILQWLKNVLLDVQLVLVDEFLILRTAEVWIQCKETGDCSESEQAALGTKGVA